MNLGSAGLGVGKIVNLLFLGYSSRSFAVFHLRLCRDNVGANGREWVDFATILVLRFFSSFPHWATYKNRLDAVFGVEWVVFRDKPVIKLTYLALAGVGRARCFPPTCCLPRNGFLSNNALTFLEVTFDHPCEIL